MPRSSQSERTAMPRRAMSSVNEVSSDSDCSTRSTRGATKVPEPCRCTRMPPLHQVLHRLAHGDARNVGLEGDVALGGQRVAGADHAAVAPRPRSIFLSCR